MKKQIELKWIKAFRQCPLVDKESGAYNYDLAYRLLYGGRDGTHSEGSPHDFSRLRYTVNESNKDEIINELIQFLHFIGIGIRKEMINIHLQRYPNDLPKLLTKCFFIFRTLAHYRDKLDLSNPYKDNYGDITFLLKIETGESIQEGSQLNIFEEMEMDLPDLYSRFNDFPAGYEDDEEVKRLFENIEKTDKCFFITGKAGTGKSTFTHYFARNTQKSVLMCAFTGIAAVNIGGQTIHSTFLFPLKPMLPEDDEIKIFNENSPHRKIIENIDAIIVDEVSMLRSDILEAMDYSLRNNGGDPGKLFGGKQLIFVGDIFQLPPVVDSSNEVDHILFKDVYKSEYFFDAPAYKKASPIFYEFGKVHRQKDQHFIELLDEIRTCHADNRVIDLINQRYNPDYSPDDKEFVITLASTNTIARTENKKRLNELRYTLFAFDAAISGEFSRDRFPADAVLELKKGAQIIFVKNDMNRRWVNGTIGKIEFVSNDVLEVKMQDGSIHRVEKVIWENRKYKYNKEEKRIVSEVIGTFTQYPIKLAWAITIHKSQGLTFDKVVIDLGTGAFVNGQLYTALSRCRTLEGIVLKRKIRKEDIIADQRLINFYETEKIIASAL